MIAGRLFLFATLSAGCVTDKLLAELTDPDAGSDADNSRLVIVTPQIACNPCNDFPAAPIFDDSPGSVVPAKAADLFADTDGGATEGGPCLLEPELGSIFPRNWLRPRFHVIPAGSQSLFEIRLHADVEQHDLVVYTASTIWTMPASIWTGLSRNVIEQPITVSIRGLSLTSPSARPSLATIGIVTIAPSEATGTIVYWTTTGGSALKGFSIGEEGVSDVLRPQQTRGLCIGCHASTPDGKFVAVSVSSDGNGNGDPAHIELRSGDGNALEPDFVTASAKALLAREQQHLPTFSKAHWIDTDRTIVTTYDKGLAWTDLLATSQTRGAAWDMLARDGDPSSYVTHPTFNHDGNVIAYTSVGVPSTIAIARETDIYLLPFVNRKGGAARPLPGASEANVNEYYASFSANDELIAFTRGDGPSSANPTFGFAPPGSTYSDPRAEIFVISAGGGVAQRLRANDPPACSGKKSPGLTNSWAKWSPEVVATGQKTYYWLTFSSNRIEPLTPQLYVSAVVIDAAGQITTYPALYLWNQPSTESNHTPAWDLFEIPPVPVK